MHNFSNRNLTIITSVIKTVSNPLYNNCIRSVFTHEERFAHTLNTIQSVKKYSQNTYIVLVEASEIPKEWETELIKQVDYYYNISQNTELKKYIDSESKALGEASILLSYLKSEHFISNKEYFNSVSKLSGRYYLEPGFINYNEIIERNKIIVQVRENFTQILTVWFCMQINEVDDFIIVLEKGFNNIKLKEGNISIEIYLYTDWVKNKEHFNASYVGVSGKCAICNELDKIHYY